MSDAQDRKVPAPRRPSLPRLRRPVEPEQPREADLSALLGEIDSLRLTLQTDLSLAAAALEAGAPDLAGELVDGDLAEVRDFGARSAARLAAMDAAADAPEDVEPVEAGVARLPRRRILSAAPLMAAAAALIGFVAFVPDRGATPSSPETTMTSAAMAGWELHRLAESGAPDEALRAAAEELNDELAQLISQAEHDPAAAQQALMLLETTTEVLAGQGDSGVLRSVLAETQLLKARLREALPVVAQRPLRPARETVRKLVPSPLAVPLVRAQPEKSQQKASQSPKPASSPQPSQSAQPSPKPSPSSPSPAASPEPSSSPSPDDEGPLPQYGVFSGW